jgi:hypothetical protein
MKTMKYPYRIFEPAVMKVRRDSLWPLKRVTLLFILSVFVTMSVKAQDYRTGIGLRTGPSFGLTAKHFVTENQALEGLLLARWGGFHVTGLYQFHSGRILFDGLHLFYGAGAHYGAFTGKADRKYYSAPDKKYTAIGVDGILGLDYNFSGFPFNISLDWKPAMNFTKGSLFWPDELAFSIRYVWGYR